MLLVLLVLLALVALGVVEGERLLGALLQRGLDGGALGFEDAAEGVGLGAAAVGEQALLLVSDGVGRAPRRGGSALS